MHWMLMPLRRYAEFSGRSRRKEFWMWVLFTAIINSILIALGFMGAESRLFSSGAVATSTLFCAILLRCCCRRFRLRHLITTLQSTCS